MKTVLTSLLVVVAMTVMLRAETSVKTLATGLKNPESVAVSDGKFYVTNIGEFNKDGDGSVVLVEDGKSTPFTIGLNDPKGITSFASNLFVTDKTRILKIDSKGKATVIAAAKDFPVAPQFLNDIVSDEKGTLYVTDSGDFKTTGAIFSIDPKGKVSLVTNGKKSPLVKAPNGVVMHTSEHLLFNDVSNGELYHLSLPEGTVTKIAEGFGRSDGLAWSPDGRLYICDHSSGKDGGKVYGIPKAGAKPVLVASGLKSAADICFDPATNQIVIPDMQGGQLLAISAQIPGFEVDTSPLPIGVELAFPDLQWTDWEGEVNGREVPLRPIVLTHAAGYPDQVFVATQQGVIHSFARDPKAKATKVFLDIEKKVKYSDQSNEEGFLGLAFHPKFKQNGEFFVFYTLKEPELTNVVSRFRVSKDDPTKADPTSEEEILRIKRPYWNHDGGTLVFGPDGYLYIALGDGGAGNDPHDNGQNLGVLLGKVLRIDVDHKGTGKQYAIPKDNPFVKLPQARPEIWCYGVRNPWRIAFDSKTGKLWCGDVGQNLWEEIDILKKGGNYGWNRREGQHPFGPKGTDPFSVFKNSTDKSSTDRIIQPIWEYDHNVGKSITGGFVYRGKQFPELYGHYLYADYVTSKMWALKYDEAAKRVVANRPIEIPPITIMSFGEDATGEAYFMTFAADGQGIYRYAKPN
ncbi:MAG: PQQ-dependent sugar dehydrogenase [Planctomycetota bacterium]|nr:PQQ-dependent sugar dehydrogenase [Planctomycetota bacterium]